MTLRTGTLWRRHSPTTAASWSSGVTMSPTPSGFLIFLFILVALIFWRIALAVVVAFLVVVLFLGLQRVATVVELQPTDGTGFGSRLESPNGANTPGTGRSAADPPQPSRSGCR